VLSAVLSAPHIRAVYEVRIMLESRCIPPYIPSFLQCQPQGKKQYLRI
jgi:hypothetical protein